MKSKQTIDILNEIYEEYKDKFNTGFHTILWALLMDGAREKNPGKSALTVVIVNGGTMLGIADYGIKGYTPTVAFFMGDVTYDDAKAIAEDLNKRIFNLDLAESFRIVLSTMRK